MRIDPNLQRSFSIESVESPPRNAAQLMRAEATIRRDLYATHREWMRTGDPDLLMRQQRLSIALERVLHRLRQA